MQKFTKPSYMTDSETKHWEALVKKIRAAEKEMDALYQKHQKENDKILKQIINAEGKLESLIDKLDDLEVKMLNRKDMIIASQRRK